MVRPLAAVSILSLLAAAPAAADETITARPVNEFAAPVTTIDQGEKVTLRNMDVVDHDVTSRRRRPDGSPLFRSDLVASGESGLVRGTEHLVTGTYPFFCSVHPGMDATLRVTSAGEPVPTPDPPEIAVRIRSRDLQRVVAERKLVLRVTSSEAGVKLVARMRTKRLGRASTRFRRSGARTVELRLSKSGRNALRGRRRAKVTVTATATDDAGQATKSSATRTLR